MKTIRYKGELYRKVDSQPSQRVDGNTSHLVYQIIRELEGLSKEDQQLFSFIRKLEAAEKKLEDVCHDLSYHMDDHNNDRELRILINTVSRAGAGLWDAAEQMRNNYDDFVITALANAKELAKLLNTRD